MALASEGKNFFALLDDQETEDVREIVDSLKVKAEELSMPDDSSALEPSKPDAASAAALDEKKEQKPKHKSQMDPRNMRAKPIILPRHVRRSFLVFRKEKKDEPKPQANGGTKEPVKKEDQIKVGQQPTEGKKHNGDHQDHQDDDQRGYRAGNGVADGYLGRYNNNDDGRYHGGRGRGRGFQPRGRFTENNNNGNEKEGEAVTYANNHQHQQLREGQEGQRYYGGYRGDHRHQQLPEGEDGQRYYGGYRGVHQGPRGRGYYNHGKVYYKVNGDKKSDPHASNNGDKKNGEDNVNVAVEAKEGKEAAASAGGDGRSGDGNNKADKDSKPKKSKSKGGQENAKSNGVNEAEKKTWINWMTLKEYEASLVEKKKPLEAFEKGWGRKVLAEEEFGSMQMIGKKKEEKKSEKKEEQKSEEKKKHPGHSHEEEKVRKATNELWKGYYESRPYGRQEEGVDGYNGGHEDGSDNSNRPAGNGIEFDAQIEDPSQFPSLGTALIP